MTWIKHPLRLSIYLFAVTILVISSLLPTLAQSGRRPSENNGEKNSEDKAIVKVKTSEVVLPVTVRNQTGTLATGLSERDFIVIEDGVRQEITSFNVRELPINIVLLLDASGSVFNELREIRAAAIKFVQQLRPIDQVSIIQFADKIELIQDWTSNQDDLAHAINWRYRPGKETHLWDGLFLAADNKMSQVEGRKAVIILTDCDDTASKITPDQAYWASVKSGTSIYVISQASSIVKKLTSQYGGAGGKLAGTKKQVDAIAAHYQQAESEMRSTAEKTGGHLYSPLKPEDYLQAYLQVAEELKNQYIITYTPANEQRDGKFRNIKVALTRGGLDVNAKEGYIAPKE